MSWSRKGSRPFAFGLIAAAAMLLSGCVYLRLLELKHQISAFDRNFTVQTDEGVKIVCRHPVLLDEDVKWIGLGPEKTKKVGSAEEWQVRWVKQLPPEAHESGEFDIVVNLLFVNHKLGRITIPERYFAVMPKTLLIDLLRSLGGARVDKMGRSVEARLASAPPDLPGIEKLLGRPTSRHAADGDETVMRYRYVPVGIGLARAAVFDMAVHFDNASGKMLRWEGQTPVGRIGFNFEKAHAGQ
jgi:hypothetical protein